MANIEINSLNDAYKELGLEPSASPDDVKKAFRMLALKHHPDKNKDDKDSEIKFKRINRAKQIIDDPDKELKQNIPDSRNDFDISSVFNFVNNSSNFVNNNSNIKKRPNPVIDINLTFEESVCGLDKSISFTRYNKCQSCNGFGHDGIDKKCTTCNGKGGKSYKQGNMSVKVPCSKCNGTGGTFKTCTKCNGDCTLPETVTGSIRIPKKVYNNQVIAVSGFGNYVGFFKDLFSNRAVNKHGDLIVKIHVEEDSDMSLNSEGNIISNLNISLLDAMKGTSLKVRSIGGEKTLLIPAKSKNGHKLMVPTSGTSHIFVLNVEYPENIDNLIEFLEKKE